LGRALGAVAPGGRIYSIGILDGLDAQVPILPLLLRRAVIQGIGVGHRRALEDMIRAIDRIGLKPVIDRTYDLADLPAALDHLDRGPFGKLVVRIGD
jgi:NADPH:quinone reductase-like Zn-dependent oxidoreductase